MCNLHSFISTLPRFLTYKVTFPRYKNKKIFRGLQKMAITQFSGLSVRQNNNIYEIYIPQGIKIFIGCMPNDGQLIRDTAALDMICKVLAMRWGIIQKNKKSNGEKKKSVTLNYGGLNVVQVDISGYQIFLPTGDLVACVLLPPDNQYCADTIGLSYVCRAMGARYGIS